MRFTIGAIVVVALEVVQKNALFFWSNLVLARISFRYFGVVALGFFGLNCSHEQWVFLLLWVCFYLIAISGGSAMCHKPVSTSHDAVALYTCRERD